MVTVKFLWLNETQNYRKPGANSPSTKMFFLFFLGEKAIHISNSAESKLSNSAGFQKNNKILR